MLRAQPALVVCLISAIAPAAALAQEDERAAHVYGIFKTHCFECHGESRKGRLDLRTYDTLVKGGMSGPVIVAHQPDESRLYQRITHADPARTMPPARPRLSSDEVAAIREWASRRSNDQSVSADGRSANGWTAHSATPNP